MEIKVPDPSNSFVTCFESGCTNKIDASHEERNIVEGRYLPVCSSCDKERPEFSLWDAQAIEESDNSSEKDCLTGHPVPEDEEYAVVDGNEMICDMFDDTLEKLNGSNEVHPEIFIRNPNDSELLREARQEARRMT